MSVLCLLLLKDQSVGLDNVGDNTLKEILHADSGGFLDAQQVAFPVFELCFKKFPAMTTDDLLESQDGPFGQSQLLRLVHDLLQTKALMAQLKVLGCKMGRRVDRQDLVQEIRELVVAKINGKAELLVGFVYPRLQLQWHVDRQLRH